MRETTEELLVLELWDEENVALSSVLACRESGVKHSGMGPLDDCSADL